MNIEIGTEAKQFPEKEYINGILVAVKKTAEEADCGHLRGISWGP